MPDFPFLSALPVNHHYRALLLDLGGKILRVRIIAGFDDEEASDMARDMLDGRAVELWDGNHLIERFGPAQA
ncbi:MAG: hypothetical protein K2Y56_25640 [Methylobacterium sp.]|uniref:hypothetical protein n=1 Tax=Methylobacterium sp. TaxID=409 RepID=UPI0025E52E13|nr:hypothetical protein [Methylobacterium sp.]MBX9934853.1 hypothetical protein [Methylobacterium sp.]